MITKVSNYIDFPITPGFMILNIEITDAGQVAKTEVIYSDISSYATKTITKRFSEARFRPAQRNGVPVPDVVLLKISFGPGS